MKLIILLCFVTLSSATVIDKIRTLKESCLQSTGVELKSVQNLRSGIFDDNDPKLKKYVACVVTKAGLITESGELNSSALKKSLIGSESEINSILDACSVKKDSVEETSYTMYKCIYGIKPSSLP